MIRLAIIFALLASPAYANCGLTEIIEARLAGQYREVAVGSGIRYDRMRRLSGVKLWLSERGSMTLTESSAEGVTCILMSAQQFALITETLPPAGDDM